LLIKVEIFAQLQKYLPLRASRWLQVQPKQTGLLHLVSLAFSGRNGQVQLLLHQSYIFVSKNMLWLFRPSFEVVKEGWILKKIRPLNLSFEHYLKYIFWYATVARWYNDSIVISWLPGKICVKFVSTFCHRWFKLTCTENSNIIFCLKS